MCLRPPDRLLPLSCLGGTLGISQLAGFRLTTLTSGRAISASRSCGTLGTDSGPRIDISPRWQGLVRTAIIAGQRICLMGKMGLSHSSTRYHNRIIGEPLKRYDHFRDQIDWICINDSLAVDFVGRFEKIDRDYDEVCGRLGVIATTLPILRASTKSATYREQYSPRMVTCVEDMYRRDVEFFEYAFDN